MSVSSTFDTLLLDVRAVGLHNGRQLGPGFQALAEVLRADYGRRVRIHDPARWNDRGKLLKNLQGWSRTHARAAPHRSRLLVLSTTCTRFVRDHAAFEAVALSSSVRGRPSTMLNVEDVFAALSHDAGAARTLVVLDLDVVSSRRESTRVDAADVARSIASVAQKWSVDLLVLTTPAHSPASAPAVEYRPQIAALLRLLKAGAHRAEAVTVTDLHRELSRRPDGLADHITLRTVVGALTAARLDPVRTRPAFPEYIIDDLFASGAGSRLDAIVELGDIIDGRSQEASPRDARQALEELAALDPDMHVRAEAVRALTAKTTLTLRDFQELEICHPRLDEQLSAGADPDFVDIPAGQHLVGVDAPGGQWFERPRFTVALPSFAIARRPVTVSQYYRFLKDTGWPVPRNWTSDAFLLRQRNHPVGYVSYYDASAYCDWLAERLGAALAPATTVALPTELEWEAAARWPHGLSHPWGDAFDPNRCNTSSGGTGSVVQSGQFSPQGDTPAGLLDMIGNVWEWTQSVWGVSGRAPATRYPLSVEQDAAAAIAPGNVRRIVRGAAYYYADECSNAYTRNRAFPDDVHLAGGFRPVLRTAGDTASTRPGESQ